MIDNVYGQPLRGHDDILFRGVARWAKGPGGLTYFLVHVLRLMGVIGDKRLGQQCYFS